MRPLVSVVIPTYKRGGDLLERALQSVLNQSYSNIEVVVVDDNSPATFHRLETEKTMDDFKKFDNVIYLKNPMNMGGGPARNQGISKTNGDYITFLDDDDVYLVQKIETQVRFMLENNLDMSFADVRIHNKNNKLVDYREHPYIKDNLSNSELLKLHIMHHLTPTATYMFKKSALLNIEGFDDVRMGQEFMLMLKAIENELKIGYLPFAHVIQYLHDGERISIGENKLTGEMELFKIKQRYFNKLNFRQRQYIKFRHHAVMMIAGKRSNRWSFVVKHFFKSIISSPVDCILETMYYFKKMNKFRQISNRGEVTEFFDRLITRN